METARITLTVTQGILKGMEYVFEDPTCCFIGRARDCDIQLPPDYAHVDVSRHHCVLEIDPPAILVRDLGSRNGTYVNGEKIGQRPADQAAEQTEWGELPAHELKDGDEIQVGHTVFRVGICITLVAPEPLYYPLHLV